MTVETKEFSQENPILKLDRMDCKELIEYQKDWLKRFIQSPRYREQLINEEQYSQKIKQYQEVADKITSSKEIHHLIDQTFGKGCEIGADAATNFLGIWKGEEMYQIESLWWNCIDVSKWLIDLIKNWLDTWIDKVLLQKRIWNYVLKYQNTSDNKFITLWFAPLYEIYYLIARQVTFLLQKWDINNTKLYCKNIVLFFKKLEEIWVSVSERPMVLKDRLGEFRDWEIEFSDEDDDHMLDIKVVDAQIQTRIDERLGMLERWFETWFDVDVNGTWWEYIPLWFHDDELDFIYRDIEDEIDFVNDEEIIQQYESDTNYKRMPGKTYFFRGFWSDTLLPIHEFAHQSVESSCLMSSYEIKMLLKYKVAQSNGYKTGSLDDYNREVTEIYAHLTTLKFIIHEMWIKDVFEEQICAEDIKKMVELYRELDSNSSIANSIMIEIDYFTNIFGIWVLYDDNSIEIKEDVDDYQHLVDCLNLIASNKWTDSQKEQIW